MAKLSLLGKINFLESLLDTLPETLSEDPQESNYTWELDDEIISEDGYDGALRRRLEVAFQTHNLGQQQLVFTERGERLKGLIELLRFVAGKMTNGFAFLEEVWIKRLANAAYASGAVAPNKMYGSLCIICLTT